MKYLDIIAPRHRLTEAVRYEDMIANLTPEGPPQELIAALARVKASLKRQDRVIWAMRWFRLIWATEQGTAWDKKAIQFAKQMVPEGTDYKIALNVLSWDNFPRALRAIEHFISLPIPEIRSTIFDKQRPEELVDFFTEEEEEWKENQSRQIIHTGYEDKIIDFGDGYAWFDLHTGYCSREATAMGHCGNAGEVTGGDILSLRRHVEGDVWTPHLTFILRDDGSLGEMKGRNNDKPSEKYHKYIIRLLQDARIKAVHGGGYRPENNFNMGQLSDSTELDELKNTKPELFGFVGQYYKWCNGDKTHGDKPPAFLIANLEKDLENRGFSCSEIKEDGTIIIDRNALRDFPSGPVSVLIDLDPEASDDLVPIIMEALVYAGSKMGRNDLYNYAERISISDECIEGYRQSLRDAVVYGYNYEVDGVSADVDFDEKGHAVVVESIDIGDYAYFCNQLDEEEYGSPDRLDAMRDNYGDDSDDYDNVDDELSAAFIQYAVSKVNKKKSLLADQHELGNTIVEHCDASASISRTQDHPDQLSLDL